MNKYTVAIDLHGTLLNKDWSIDPSLIDSVLKQMTVLKKYADLFLCTGNNLDFVNEYVAESVRELIDGYILETGSVYCNRVEEEILIDEYKLIAVNQLESELRMMNLPDVLFFAERKATISIFTRYKQQGNNPENLYRLVKGIITDKGLDSLVTVTHSDVAVDIVTAGTDKYAGLRRISKDNRIIAIADSYNDIELLCKADLSFIPANAYDFSREKRLKILFKGIDELSVDSSVTEKVFYRSSLPFTEGVVDILKKLNLLICAGD